MTKRKLAVSRRQLTLSSREVLVAGIFIVVVASMSSSVDAGSTAVVDTASWNAAVQSEKLTAGRTATR